MRLLYEINADLENLLNQVDEETGELLATPEAIEALMLEREESLEGLALWIKNATAEAYAIRAEELALADRRKRLENRAERAKALLQDMLAGDKLQTSRVLVSYRRSKSVEVSPDFLATAPIEYIRVKNPEPNLDAIGKALKAGKEVPGATLVEKTSMSIR